ncbi:MAG: hypothetical protein UY95_C0006G0001, partial [Parcubacteria group bacterium GW2011_GWA2_56_7]
EMTWTQRKGALDLNPVAYTEGDLEWVLNQAYGR